MYIKTLKTQLIYDTFSCDLGLFHTKNTEYRFPFIYLFIYSFIYLFIYLFIYYDRWQPDIVIQTLIYSIQLYRNVNK